MPNYVSDGAWGTGLGVPLNVAQFDGNTFEFDTRISDLEDNPPDANGIASITLNGLALSFTLEGGEVLGPYPLPIPLPHNRGEWMPAQLYEALDQFTIAGSGLYVVLLDHVTAGSFDANAVGPAETAGAFIVGRTYVIATVGTTDFTLIGADSSTVGVEFKATGAGSGTGIATPKLYHLLVGSSSNTILTDLADVDVSGAAANAMLVAVSVGSPATIEWQDRTPTQVTALLDVFEGAVGSPADGGLKGLVPAPTAADAAAGRVLGASGGWVIASTVAALDDLTDVSTSGAVVGSVLRAAGSPLAWSPDLLSLDDLSDVALSSPAVGDFLRYDGGSPNGWTNEAGTATSDLDAATLPLNLASLLQISEASGSPATYESKQLTIADLFDAGEITLGSTAVVLGATVTTIAGLTLSNGTLGGSTTLTGMTAGSVLFAGASSVLSQDNANLFWDDTNNRLGVGTASPGARVDVRGGELWTPRLRSIQLVDGSNTTIRRNIAYFSGTTDSIAFGNNDNSGSPPAFWSFITSAGGGRVGIGLGLDVQPDASLHLAVGSTYRLSNLRTDASNGEWYQQSWSGNVFSLGTNQNGTGVARNLQIIIGGTPKLNYGITTAAVWTAADALNCLAALTAHSGTAIPAGGTAGAGLKVSSTANFGVFFGSGAPTLSAAKGSLYLRSDGSATSNRAYINSDGGTTWTALTTAA